MATNSDVLTMDFRELNGCTAMALSNAGKFALIAGRRVFGLIDLDQPTQIAKLEQRKSKYDVSAVEFNYDSETCVAVASNDKIEIFDWAVATDLKPTQVIKGHNRIVTDLSWQQQQPHILASSSYDNFIHVWDIRDFRKPTHSLESVTGASQIHWELVSGKYLSSAHDGEIRVWDIRMSNMPLKYVNAHLNKIYAISFSPNVENRLVSTSHDLTVKFWDVASQKQGPLSTIKVPESPVWKVRFAPFGEGLVTLVMNTLLRRENNLMLWNIHNFNNAVHTFYGHSDMVLEFGWRSKENRANCELVTWSKDLQLKIWPVGDQLKEMCCGAEENSEEECSARMSTTSRSSTTTPSELTPPLEEFDQLDMASTPLDIAHVPDDSSLSRFRHGSLEDMAPDADLLAHSVPPRLDPANLRQEFSLINFGNRLVLQKLDVEERYCIIEAQTFKKSVALQVKFPLNYPNREPPLFAFMSTTTVDNATRSQILRKLKLTANQQVNKNLRCLEICLRQFESAINAIYLEEQQEETRQQAASVAASNAASNAGSSSGSNSGSKYTTSVVLGSYQDTNVPFPRSSGARFCSNGKLVCFGWAKTVKVPSTSMSESIKTPRALSALSSVPAGSTPPMMFGQSPSLKPNRRFSSNSSGGGPLKRRVSSMAGGGNEVADPSRRGRVTIYDCSAIMPFKKIMAEKSLIFGDISEVCHANASLAKSFGLKTIAQTWLTAAYCARLGPCTVRQGHANCSCPDSSPEEPVIQDPNRALLPGAHHPCGRRLLETLIDHHLEQRDIQTAALICCVFRIEPKTDDESDDEAPSGRKKNSKSECSTDTGGDLAMEAVAFGAAMAGHVRSNSDTTRAMDGALSYLGRSYCEQLRNEGIKNEQQNDDDDVDDTILDPEKDGKWEEVKRAYAGILTRWGMTERSAEVTKCLSKSDVRKVSVNRQCADCGRRFQGQTCDVCRRPTDRCALCRIPVRGVMSMCLACGHGGHTHHMAEWFQERTFCATGCGCKCIL